MDIVKIRTEVEILLRDLNPNNVDWKVVVEECRKIVIANAPNLNDFNIKIGRDIGKYQFQIVVPMVFKF